MIKNKNTITEYNINWLNLINMSAAVPLLDVHSLSFKDKWLNLLSCVHDSFNNSWMHSCIFTNTHSNML